MVVAVSSDEYSPLVASVIHQVEERGHRVLYRGPTGSETDDDNPNDWPLVTHGAASLVASGEADEGVVMCWTGTGASIAANKLPGIRAALCGDAETARGARIWNHANVLALSIRATSIPVAEEILKMWFETPISSDEWNIKQMERVKQIEAGEKPV